MLGTLQVAGLTIVPFFFLPTARMSFRLLFDLYKSDIMQNSSQFGIQILLLYKQKT